MEGTINGTVPGEAEGEAVSTGGETYFGQGQGQRHPLL